METAIFIPSLYRSDKLKPLIHSVERTTNEPYHLYFMVPEHDYFSRKVLDEMNQTYWTDRGHEMRFVKRIQYMYEHTDEELFFTGADDLLFHQDWLRIALEDLKPELGAVVFNDLHNPNGTNFLIRRSYIENHSGVLDAPNTVFHQGYFHNYCDTEFINTAHKRNMFGRTRAVVEHMHPHAGKAEDDQVYQMAREFYDMDARLFSERSRLWT